MGEIVNVVIPKAVDQIPYIAPQIVPEGSKKRIQSCRDKSFLAH